MHLEKLQNVGVILISFLEPDKGLLPVIESEIRVHKSCGRNIPPPLPLFQFLHQSKRIGPSPRVRICPDEDTRYTGASAA